MRFVVDCVASADGFRIILKKMGVHFSYVEVLDRKEIYKALAMDCMEFAVQLAQEFQEETQEWTVGRTDQKIFRTKDDPTSITMKKLQSQEEAENFILEVEKYDPRGVHAGEYYIDGPKDWNEEIPDLAQQCLHSLCDDSEIFDNVLAELVKLIEAQELMKKGTS